MQYSYRVRHDGNTFPVTNVKMLLSDSGALPLHYHKVEHLSYFKKREKNSQQNKMMFLRKMLTNNYTYIKSCGKKLTDSVTLNAHVREETH